MKTSETFLPIARKLTILLADDDNADCLLFKEALAELPVSANFSTVQNGEQLLQQLTKKGSKLPDVVFLDLNMPRKNGFATLGEIKRDVDLERLPVIIFSTSQEPDGVNRVFRDAAHYYIRKPTQFSELKKVIYEALVLITQEDKPFPEKEDFILIGDLRSKPK
jgi:CheY-like chemotaxis protein